MSRSGYTASERRGILMIAFFSLLLVGAGLGVSMCDGIQKKGVVEPIITEYPQMIDSVAINKVKKEKTSKKIKQKKSKKVKKQKTYRQRSPLDEPV